MKQYSRIFQEDSITLYHRTVRYYDFPIQSYLLKKRIRPKSIEEFVNVIQSSFDESELLKIASSLRSVSDSHLRSGGGSMGHGVYTLFNVGDCFSKSMLPFGMFVVKLSASKDGHLSFFSEDIVQRLTEMGIDQKVMNGVAQYENEDQRYRSAYIAGHVVHTPDFTSLVKRGDIRSISYNDISHGNVFLAYDSSVLQRPSSVCISIKDASGSAISSKWTPIKNLVRLFETEEV